MTTTTANSATWTRGAGPLTTVFTTPDFCQSLYWHDTITPPLSSIICMPPRFKQLYDYEWGYYSPGICPTGYSEGCSFPNSIATSGVGWIKYGGPVDDNETVRLCCPTGYTCLTGAVSSYSKCVATTDAADMAFAIQVRWQESDLSILETDPTVPGSTYSASATVTSAMSTTGSTTESGATPGSSVTSTNKATSAASTGTSLADLSPDSGRLSNKATIGIAIGAGTAAFAISALIFFIWFRRRKRKEMSGMRINSMATMSDNAPDESIAPGGGRIMEMDSTATLASSTLSELDSANVVAEMPVPHFVAELPGSMPADYKEEVEESQEKFGEKDANGFDEGGETSQRESEALGGQWRRRSTLKKGRSRLAITSSSGETSPNFL